MEAGLIELIQFVDDQLVSGKKSINNDGKQCEKSEFLDEFSLKNSVF